MKKKDTSMTRQTRSPIVFCLIMTIGWTATSDASAALLAYYVDGTDADAAALVDLANAANVTASNLANVGFEGGTSITRTEFGTSTPDGPTATESGAGSEWLFARANFTGGTPPASPVSTTDYFGYSVTALGGTLKLTSVTFDWTNINNINGSIVSEYIVFVSIDNGSFVSFGTDTLAWDGSGFTTPATEVIDLSSISGASSVEIRIALSDNSTSDSKATYLQGIQLNGIVVPTPAALPTGLAMLGLFAARRRRRVIA